ncbi:MAG TPA: twin-arginine translocase subunit TatC [Pirellulales bacterium]|nr:twin-arginine translocase subunit TatC [Pirellulales bacterium]
MLKPHEDDLFRQSTMTFGEHLEELRRRLFRAVIWLVVGLVVGLFIGRQVVHLIESPLTKSLAEYYADKADVALKAKFGDQLPAEDVELMKEGFVAEQVNVQPSKLIDALSGVNPDAAPAAIRLPTYRLTATDITNPRLLAETIQAASADEAKPTPARRIWEKLQPADRKLATAIADNKDADPDPKQVAQLADALSRLVSSSDFSDPEEDFPATAISDSTVALLLARRKDLKPNEVQRLNWLLLAAAAPDAIGPPHPYLAALTIWRPGSEDERIRPKAMSATEAFVIYMKAAFIAGLIIFSPMIFRELWLFVAAGLYPHERRYVHIFLPFSVVLFVSGALLAFFAAFPPVLHFLFSFNDWLGIPPEPRIGEWLSFVLFLPLAFGIGFQLPLVMLFLNRIGLITVEAYLRGWRVAVLVIFVLAPILNPSPDPYSMLLMAVPMTALYFGGILLCKYASRRKPTGIGGE